MITSLTFVHFFFSVNGNYLYLHVLTPSSPQRHSSDLIPWRFDPYAKGQLDEPFRALVTIAGKRVVADLDEIVLDVPKQAAIRASKVFKQYAQGTPHEGRVRDVMQSFADTMNLDHRTADAILPPEAIWHASRQHTNIKS